MFLFPFFPLPAVVTNVAPALWATIYAILLLLEAVFTIVGLLMLAHSGLSGQYDPAEALWGWLFLLGAAVIFFFHGWAVLTVALAAFVYFIVWRVFIKNLLVALDSI